VGDARILARPSTRPGHEIHLSGSAIDLRRGAPLVPGFGRSNWSDRGCSRAPPDGQVEVHSASDAMDRTRPRAERRARTTTGQTIALVQNGTSGVFASGKHNRRRVTWPRREPANREYCVHGEATEHSGAPGFEVMTVRTLPLDALNDRSFREPSPGGSCGTVPLRRMSELGRSRSGFPVRDRLRTDSCGFRV